MPLRKTPRGRSLGPWAALGQAEPSRAQARGPATSGAASVTPGSLLLFLLRYFLESSDPRQRVRLTVKCPCRPARHLCKDTSKVLPSDEPSPWVHNPPGKTWRVSSPSALLTMGSSFSGHSAHTCVLYVAALESSYLHVVWGGPQLGGKGFCE